MLDPQLASVVAGPKDLTQKEDVWASAAAAGASSFFVAAVSNDGLTIRAHTIDPKSGNETATTTLGGNTSNVLDVHAIALHGGWAVSFSRGNRVAFAWAPESLASPWVVTESLPGGSVGSASLAAIDAKHAAIAWTDGTVRAASVTCGP